MGGIKGYGKVGGIKSSFFGKGLPERCTEAFKMFNTFSKGLGQLEAYVDVEEGVAFQTDNGLFWDSLGGGSQWAVEGILQKRASSKFRVIRLTSGKVLIRNWIGLFLAPVKDGRHPYSFFIEPVQYSQSDSLRFDVFFRGNKVAFRAYNGLFLAMVQRGFHALEAATFFADESCGFRPLIGDLSLPVFQLLTVVPTDLSQVIYYHEVVVKESYVNRSEVPVKHRFHLSWNTFSYDKIAWCHPWGLGVASSFSFMIEEAKAKLQYTEDNDLALMVYRQVSEEITEEVEVPPNMEATVQLWAEKRINASVPFIAEIQKLKPDGSEVIMNEPGAWNGLLYRNLQPQITMKELRSPRGLCAVM